MTIALGALTADAVILAADTEETSAYLKTGQSKLAIATYVNDRDSLFGRCACAMSGAGDGGHIDALTAELTRIFLDHPTPSDDPESYLRAKVLEFYRTHVIPFAAYPELERPDVELVLGMSQGPARSLLVSNKTTLRVASPYVAVGAGAAFAKMLLDRFWRSALDVREAALLLAYVVWHVKESVPYCGKFTEMIVLQNGVAQYVPADDLRAAETLFRRYGSLERMTLHGVLGARTDSTQAEHQATTLRDEFTKLVRRLIPAYPLGMAPVAGGVSVGESRQVAPPTRSVKRRQGSAKRRGHQGSKHGR